MKYQIRFKAWSKKEKRFITDYKRILTGHYDFPIEKGGLDQSHNVISLCEVDDSGEEIPDDYLRLLLCSYIRDKNKLFIYEEDIVKWQGEICVVKRHAGGLVLQWDDICPIQTRTLQIFKQMTPHIEIIGNTFEHLNLFRRR